MSTFFQHYSSNVQESGNFQTIFNNFAYKPKLKATQFDKLIYFGSSGSLEETVILNNGADITFWQSPEVIKESQQSLGSPIFDSIN